jgi:uncharacterized protein (TIGR02147 family)
MKTEAYYKSILEEELAKRAEKNPRYSLRAMARALRLEAGALSQILTGKRIPSYKMAQKILAALDLTPDQQNLFLGSLAKSHQSRGLERMNPLFKKTKHAAVPKDLSIDLFRIVGDWYHYAVMMLTYVEGFDANPKWIASQIGISPLEARLAVKRLLDLGLLKEERGTLTCFSGHFTTADKQLTSAALKRHQKQVLDKSIFSLENDPIEERSHTSMTMAIDPKRISEAKKLIEDFTNKMSELLESGKRLQVYEFNIGLFPIQKTRRDV